MSQNDDWPRAPILATLPATARLRPRFDPDPLIADVERLSGETWAQPRIIGGDGLGAYATRMDWRTLSLRSIGGDPSRTDPGGPELADFADTPLRDQAPNLSKVLAAIPAPLRAARLMALGPGAESPVHLDTKCGLPWGKLRLHVPIVTTPHAVLEIGGTTHCWPSGELWYADFTRMHVVRNTGSTTRVHLVIDCVPTKEVLELFPPEFQAPDVLSETLLARSATPLSPPVTRALRCRFDMPAAFRSFEEADGDFMKDGTMIPARIDYYRDGLALYLNGSPELALIHIGDHEFRFAGWTTERTVQVCRDAGRAQSVVMRSHAGSTTYARRIRADPVT